MNCSKSRARYITQISQDTLICMTPFLLHYMGFANLSKSLWKFFGSPETPKDFSLFSQLLEIVSSLRHFPYYDFMNYIIATAVSCHIILVVFGLSYIVETRLNSLYNIIHLPSGLVYDFFWKYKKIICKKILIYKMKLKLTQKNQNAIN